MRRTFTLALLPVVAGVWLPSHVYASLPPASFEVARSVLMASSSPGNVYAAGASVVVTAPVAGDLLAGGGSIVSAGEIQGDELLFAGSIRSRAAVAGDFRAFGGSVSIDEPVSGDLFAVGYGIHDAGRAAGSVFIAAINVSLTNGAAGPVTLYGNTISLAGDFAGDVNIFASGRITLAEGTAIHGKLSYEAPEPALVPASATIDGGVEYTNASYLPDVGTSRILALVSVGFFLFARILGALIIAGLLAGLFPRFAEAVTSHAHMKRSRDVFLTMLLGFGVLVATPVLLILLSLTFVGLGLALLLFILYALLAFLAVIYAGIIVGGVFARRFLRRETILWRDGALGMLALSLIALIPVIGLFAVSLLTLFSAGTLLQIFFQFAYPREERTAQML